MIQKVQESDTVVITAHGLADVDALASTTTLKYYLEYQLALKPDSSPQLNGSNSTNQSIDKAEPKAKSSKIRVVLTQRNRLAKKISQDLIPDLEIEEKWPSKVDLLILVDCYDIALAEIPTYAENGNEPTQIKQIIIIDHHIQPNELDPRVVMTHFLSNYSSASEIITEFFMVGKYHPPELVEQLLIMGILTDTGNFRYANNHTLETTEFLLENDKNNLREITGLLQMPVPRPERIARIRAAMRIEELYYINDYIIAISHVSAYEASSCKALIDLGADLSFVVAYEKKEQNFRVSGRASEGILHNTKLHLGKVMALIGERFGGSGGGHNGAAGCYGSLLEDNFMSPVTLAILESVKKAMANGANNSDN